MIRFIVTQDGKTRFTTQNAQNAASLAMLASVIDSGVWHVSSVIL